MRKKGIKVGEVMREMVEYGKRVGRGEKVGTLMDWLNGLERDEGGKLVRRKDKSGVKGERKEEGKVKEADQVEGEVKIEDDEVSKVIDFDDDEGEESRILLELDESLPQDDTPEWPEEEVGLNEDEDIDNVPSSLEEKSTE